MEGGPKRIGQLVVAWRWLRGHFSVLGERWVRGDATMPARPTRIVSTAHWPYGRSRKANPVYADSISVVMANLRREYSPRHRRGSATGALHSGFTIIEVMIVLVVSSGLFIAAAVLISGRQSQTSFDQAVRDVQAEIQQTINEVAVGYFPDATFNCVAGGSGPNISNAGSTGQGTNSGCVFLGKAMQFKLAGTSPEQYAVYSIAGLQQSGGLEAQNLAQALPKAVAPGSAESSIPNYPDLTIIRKLQNGLTTNPNAGSVNGMWFNNGAANIRIGAVAFISSLASYDVGGGINQGAQQVIVYPVRGSALDTTKTQGIDAINGIQFRNPALSPPDPSGGVFICFASGGTNASGLIKIGGSKRTLSVTLRIIKGNTTCS